MKKQRYCINSLVAIDCRATHEGSDEVVRHSGIVN